MAAWIERWRLSPAGRWLDGLEERDRSIVLGLALLLAVVLFFVVVWRPIFHWSDAEDERYRSALGLIDWMHKNEADARKQGQAADHPAGPDTAVIANTAASAGLQISRYQPEAGGGVSVVLQGQDFNAVVRWVAGLEQQQQLVVKQMSIDAQGDPGRVNARINLM
jgi:general secretion pathway protein M